jgi:hypothetical protein
MARYHATTHGPSKEGFIIGLLKAVDVAKANGTNEVLLSVHTLSNLEGVIRDTLGEDVLKRFTKERVGEMDGVKIHLETEKIRSAFSKGVIFAPFVSTKLLTKLEGDFRGTDIVYVPWAETERDAYVAANPSSVALSPP